MPLCPRCHGYYTRPPCPVCGEEKKKSKISMVDENNMSVSEILDKGEELLTLRNLTDQLRIDIQEKDKELEIKEQQIKKLQMIKKKQDVEIDDYQKKFQRFNKEIQSLNTQINTLQDEISSLKRQNQIKTENEQKLQDTHPK
ncbi:MAG: coiled-coil domain-containing protein [Promethearchaeota archaeon]